MLITEYKLNTCIRSKSALDAETVLSCGQHEVCNHYSFTLTHRASWECQHYKQGAVNQKWESSLQNCCTGWLWLSLKSAADNEDRRKASCLRSVCVKQNLSFCLSRPCHWPYWSIILHYKRHAHIKQNPNYTASAYPAERFIHPNELPSDSSH